MADLFKISECKTDTILTHYYANPEVEGLCIFTLNKYIKEQIKLMQNLCVAGSGHVDRMYSIKSFLPEDFNITFLNPTINPNSICSDKSFVKSMLSEGEMFWYLSEFNNDNINVVALIQNESIFIDVLTDSLYFTAVPYLNQFFTAQAFTHKIKLSDIKQ